MQHATEMAVMSSIQHPNIVTVYSCLTDMVEASGAGAPGIEGPGRGGPGDSLPPALRPRSLGNRLAARAHINSGPLLPRPAPRRPADGTPRPASASGPLPGVLPRSCSGAAAPARYRRIRPDEDSTDGSGTFDIVVMEVRGGSDMAQKMKK
jgi:hypothetical protein